MSKLALINQLLGAPPNASEHGYQVDQFIAFSHWFMAALFVGWSAYFIYVLVRFRQSKHPRADHHGVKSAISTHLEFSVVLIEAVLLVGFAVPLWAKRVNQFPDTKNAILVHAVGQQFNWTFHMPGPDGVFGKRDANLVSNTNQLGLDSKDPSGRDDIVVGTELHVPVNRSVIIELSSKDVIHNFALPHMRIAGDAIPGSRIPMWFKPIKTGTYEVICGQLCGLGHYSMKGTLVVDNEADYQAWIKERVELGGAAAPAAAPSPGGPPAGVPAPQASPNPNPSPSPEAKKGI